MAKLQNLMRTLDDVIVGGRNFGPGTLVAVSDLTDLDARAPTGVKWLDFVAADYRWIQQRALTEKAVRLPIKEGVEVLQDPTEKAYTAMSIIIPSKKSKFGFVPVVMARPDAQYFKDGTPYVPLWFNSTAQPGFEKAYLNNKAKSSLVDVIAEEARKLMKPLAGENPLMFSDNQNTPGTKGLLAHGWKMLISDLSVPSLSAEGAALDERAIGVDLLYRSDEGLPPWEKVQELVQEYLVQGYEVPGNGELMKQAMQKVDALFK
ncbi:MAG: hypothetical protein V1702_03575 [Candidatus Woesearchaeota archaeon]